MSKFIKLSTQEKENIRRLTQLANRRIRTAMREYQKEGLSITPKEVTGNIQTMDDWNTVKNPLSRSTQFETQSAYKAHLKYLESFDPKIAHQPKPTIKQYAKVQKKKMSKAIETVTEGELTEELKRKIANLSSAELSKFWNGFSEIGSMLGLEYASDSALTDYAKDYFKEDVLSVIEPEDEE